MDENAFWKGYLLVGSAAVIGAAAVILVDVWWVDMLAFLGVGIAVKGVLGFYTEKILDYWKKEDPGACEAHRRMLPPWFDRAPRPLCIDPHYPYRPKDRELVEEWKFFKRTGVGACLFIWLLLLVCILLFE